MTTTIHKAGDTVAGRYDVKAYVDAGGMQEVYRAVDGVLKREVALKVPKNASAERRFARSAILSARINHPNVAKTLDFVEDNNRPYLIEEFIKGEDLQRVRRRLAIMDPYLAAHLLHHMARGVAASHHAGVVHRDLKPSNIMVAPDLSFAFVKITDFGIAKMAQEEIAAAAGAGEREMTSSQTAVGALPYMAPEMILTPRSTDTPSDVWALASMAYEFVSGKKPFGAGWAAAANIINGTFPGLPPELNKTQFKGLGEEVFALVQRCWARDPAERPTADELVKLCGQLCYPPCSRSQGVVARVSYDAYGFIDSDSGSVFFHMDSVYGPRPAAGDTVCFAAFDGHPAPRAHPVVTMRSDPAVATSSVAP